MDREMVDFSCLPILWQFWTLFLFLIVQFSFGWTWKHANSGEVVRYIPRPLVVSDCWNSLHERIIHWFDVGFRNCPKNSRCIFKVTSWMNFKTVNAGIFWKFKSSCMPWNQNLHLSPKSQFICWFVFILHSQRWWCMVPMSRFFFSLNQVWPS